jgi:lipoprotein-anchoring transpeptidase ErfK/SrfK
VAALSAVTALVLSACGSDHVSPGRTVTRTVVAPGGGASSTDGGISGSSSAPGTPSTSTSTHTKPPKPKGLPVQVSSAVIGDGSQVGVGMPIILLLSRQIKDAHAFANATKVTVNGKVVHGGWFFERKYADPGHPVEADYRLQTYWPAHASIHMDLPVKGVSAGKGLIFANDLTLDFSTGAAHILTVDNATHRMTVVSDGKVWGKFPVSLGYPNTPTRRGVKVIMEKGKDISMRGPGYFDPHVKFTQRLTYDGEYLHSAPWNCTGSPGCVGPQNNIGHANSSNGCTNLTPTDAKKLYNFLEIGDVVKYPNADGPLMQLGDGYGDWNVPWPQWKTGGLYSLL